MYEYKQSYKVFNSKFRPSFSMNYLIAEPKDKKENEKLPMIVCLHGAGEGGNKLEVIKSEGIPKYLDNGLPVRAIILAPQVPDLNHIWNTLCDETAEIIDFITEEYNVDNNRISLTGYSMGGYGTWEIGMSYHDKFSALAPICGGGVSWRAGLLSNMPIRAFHGTADDTVPCSCSIEMIDKITSAGGHPELILLHNVGHYSWGFAYEDTNLMEWLVSQKRQQK